MFSSVLMTRTATNNINKCVLYYVVLFNSTENIQQIILDLHITANCQQQKQIYIVTGTPGSKPEYICWWKNRNNCLWEL